jgi:hypothetical protein
MSRKRDGGGSGEESDIQEITGDTVLSETHLLE